MVSGHKNNPPYTMEQTGGCSAAQILAAMGIGGGNERFGLSRGQLETWVASVP